MMAITHPGASCRLDTMSASGQPGSRGPRAVAHSLVYVTTDVAASSYASHSSPAELIFHVNKGNNILKSNCGLSGASLGKWMGPQGHINSVRTGPCVWSSWHVSKGWNNGAKFSLKSNYILCI